MKRSLTTFGLMLVMSVVLPIALALKLIHIVIETVKFVADKLEEVIEGFVEILEDIVNWVRETKNSL